MAGAVDPDPGVRRGATRVFASALGVVFLLWSAFAANGDSTAPEDRHLLNAQKPPGDPASLTREELLGQLETLKALKVQCKIQMNAVQSALERFSGDNGSWQSPVDPASLSREELLDQRDALKVQADAAEVQMEAAEFQREAAEFQIDAAKAQMDAAMVQLDAVQVALGRFGSGGDDTASDAAGLNTAAPRKVVGSAVAGSVGRWMLETAAGPGTKISGGNEIIPGRYPYMAMLEHHGSICGGVLIHSRVVLTTASCVYDLADADNYDGTDGEPVSLATLKTWNVYVGRERGPKKDSGTDKFTTHKILQYAQHESFIWDQFVVNDSPDFFLALLENDAEVDPVTLAQNETDSPDNETAMVLGWGTDRPVRENLKPADFLKEATVSIAVSDTCGLFKVVDGSKILASDDTKASSVPSKVSSLAPSSTPSAMPSRSGPPSSSPSEVPSDSPSGSPSGSPSTTPSADPSSLPSAKPSSSPSAAPSYLPTRLPSGSPTAAPSALPSTPPSGSPSTAPTSAPSLAPTSTPFAPPSADPTLTSSKSPSVSTCLSVCMPACLSASPKYWVVCGQGSLGCREGIEKEAEADEHHKVRCCSDTHLDGWNKKGRCSVWASSLTCHETSFDEAEELCAGAGGRLCTREELVNRCTQRSGCGFNRDLIWSSSPVGPNASPPAFSSIAVPSTSKVQDDVGQGQESRGQLQRQLQDATQDAAQDTTDEVTYVVLTNITIQNQGNISILDPSDTSCHATVQEMQNLFERELTRKTNELQSGDRRRLGRGTVMSYRVETLLVDGDTPCITQALEGDQPGRRLSRGTVINYRTTVISYSIRGTVINYRRRLQDSEDPQVLLRKDVSDFLRGADLEEALKNRNTERYGDLKLFRQGKDNVLCGKELDGFPCNGDGGGPLLRTNVGASGDLLVGILSYRPPVCGSWEDGYSKVSWAHSWIEEELQDWGLTLGTLPPTGSPAPSTTLSPSEWCQNKVKVVINTDLFPEETSWELIDHCSGSTVARGGNQEGHSYIGYNATGDFYAPNMRHEHEYCLPTSAYKFILRDSYGDGICCDYGEGQYEVFMNEVLEDSGGIFFNETTFGRPCPARDVEYFIACGNRTGCGEDDEKEADVTENHPVRCCSDTYVQGWTKRGECDVWASSLDTLDPGCYETSFSAAVKRCAGVGARLCTKEELMNGCTEGSGCNFDNRLIWSSTLVQTEQPSELPSALPTEFPTSSHFPTDSPTSTHSPTTTVLCESLVKVEILTDRYPSETTWELIDDCSGSTVDRGGESYLASTRYEYEFCLPGTQHKFVIRDSYGDGICCVYGEGEYKLFVNGALKASGGDFSSVSEVPFGSPCPSEPSDCPESESKIRVEINTDSYPDETSWDLIDVCSSTTVGSVGVGGYGSSRRLNDGNSGDVVTLNGEPATECNECATCMWLENACERDAAYPSCGLACCDGSHLDETNSCRPDDDDHDVNDGGGDSDDDSYDYDDDHYYLNSPSPTYRATSYPPTLSPTYRATTYPPTLSPTYRATTYPPTLSPTYRATTYPPTLSPTYRATTYLPTSPYAYYDDPFFGGGGGGPLSQFTCHEDHGSGGGNLVEDAGQVTKEECAARCADNPTCAAFTIQTDSDCVLKSAYTLTGGLVGKETCVKNNPTSPTSSYSSYPPTVDSSWLVGDTSLHVHEYCHPLTAFQFTIRDTYGDGICCGAGMGGYKIFIDGELQAEGGEFSLESEATFGRPCQQHFYSSDIGDVGIPGSASISGDGWEVEASGADIGGASDEFHYVYVPAVGDVSLEIFVECFSHVEEWSKAGLMVRENIDIGSRYYYIFLTGTEGIRVQYRSEQNGEASWSDDIAVNITQNVWLKLTKSDNDFTSAYKFEDSEDWMSMGGPTAMTMSESFYVGVAVTSHDNTRLATLDASRFSSTPQIEFHSRDIGNVEISGSANLSDDGWEVEASGADIWGTSDQFQYVYLPVEGDISLEIFVDSFSHIHEWSKGGLMVRENLGTGSRYYFTMVTGTAGIRYQYRSSQNSYASDSGDLGININQNIWLKLIKSGNQFTSAYKLEESEDWMAMGGPRAIDMSDNFYIGIAVTSHDNTGLATLHASQLAYNSTSIEPTSAFLDLSLLSSPYSGSTQYSENQYQTSCGGNGNEAVFMILLEPGQFIDIGQTWNDYDSRHELSWGGDGPGQNVVACTDDPDLTRHQWTNTQSSGQNVFFVVDAYSTGSGSFTLSWNVGFPTNTPSSFPTSTHSPSDVPRCLSEITSILAQGLSIDASGYTWAVGTTALATDNHLNQYSLGDFQSYDAETNTVAYEGGSTLSCGLYGARHAVVHFEEDCNQEPALTSITEPSGCYYVFEATGLCCPSDAPSDEPSKAPSDAPSHAPSDDLEPFNPLSTLVTYHDQGSCGPRGDDAQADLGQCSNGYHVVKSKLWNNWQVVATIDGCNYYSYTVYECTIDAHDEPSTPTYAPTGSGFID